MRLESFPPIAAPDARVLVLGSMPGAESLRRAQYYAHPRNSLWWILGELLGALPELDYEQRAERVRAAGLALWDVLQFCHRTGSLDADIERATEVPNDFAGFFDEHPEVHTLFFNGRKAYESYARQVLPQLAPAQARLERVLLPSTSPAHASLTRQAKLESWTAVRTALAERS